VWPQSDVYKTIGDDFTKGWQLYLDSRGGRLGGRQVETVVVDEGNGRERVRPGIKKLIEQDKVDWRVRKALPRDIRRRAPPVRAALAGQCARSADQGRAALAMRRSGGDGWLRGPRDPG
jgi:hypothetical protein